MVLELYDNFLRLQKTVNHWIFQQRERYVGRQSIISYQLVHCLKWKEVTMQAIERVILSFALLACLLEAERKKSLIHDERSLFELLSPYECDDTAYIFAFSVARKTLAETFIGKMLRFNISDLFQDIVSSIKRRQQQYSDSLSNNELKFSSLPSSSYSTYRFQGCLTDHLDDKMHCYLAVLTEMMLFISSKWFSNSSNYCDDHV